jgi:hypothetical protein
MDAEEEPSRQQGRPLPFEPLRQDPPQTRVAYVSHLYFLYLN